MTDQVPSKDLSYELRRDVLRDYQDERQLKHDSAAEIERLQRELARVTGEREPPHCSTCACGLAAEPGQALCPSCGRVRFCDPNECGLWHSSSQPPPAEHPDLSANANPYCRLCGGDHWVGAHDIEPSSQRAGQ